MNRLAMSNAGSTLLRLLIARAGVPRNRILLTEIESVEWRSLTFNGERHRMSLRVSEPDSVIIVDRMCDGLVECELSAAGLIVVGRLLSIYAHCKQCARLADGRPSRNVT